jgi:hypothetical protein
MVSNGSCHHTWGNRRTQEAAPETLLACLDPLQGSRYSETPEPSSLLQEVLWLSVCSAPLWRNSCRVLL